MKKRLIALLLSISLVFTLTLSTYAAEPVTIPDNSLLTATLNIDDTSVVMNYRLDNGAIVYAEIGEDTFTFTDNQVYCNGELLATITSIVTDTAPNYIEPRTSWIYTSTCPYGSPSEYSQYLKRVKHNIQLEKELLEFTLSQFLGVMLNLIPFQFTTEANDVFGAIFDALAAEMVEDLSYGYSRYLYSYEFVYSHSVVGSAYHQNIFFFYKDSTCTDSIDDTTAFSFWA